MSARNTLNNDSETVVGTGATVIAMEKINH
jgi:hypothetical protein